MLEFVTDIKEWGIKQLTDIKGADFSVAFSFTNSTGDEILLPMVSADNKIWQVAKDDFVVLSGHEIFHIRLSRANGAEILFRASAEIAKGLFDMAFFYFEDGMGISYIYSVIDGLEIRSIFEKLIDPMISVSVEKQPLRIRIEAPYITARFLLRKPLDDASDLTLEDSVVDSGRDAGMPLLCLGFCDCSVGWVRNFDDFAKLAKERCTEVRIAEYYEKSGGYLIRGKMARGIFHLKEYTSGNIYEFLPEAFFNDIAIPRLLSENHLVEVGPSKKCGFFGITINTPDFSIGLSRDLLIINEHGEDERKYALEMYGETCLGIRQIGEKSFLAILSENPAIPTAEIKRFSKYPAGDKYAWDVLDPINGGKSYVYPIFSQLTDDIILFEKEPTSHTGCHDYEMWSISKNQLVNTSNMFYELCQHAFDPSVGHIIKQILVKPAGEENIDKNPQIMIVIRLYRPKEYCDVYALIDPQKKYRVYGKAYNMLSDSMTKKPKTLSALVKLFKENISLKPKIEYFLEHI